MFLTIRVQQSETWVPKIINFHHFPCHWSLPGVGDQYLGAQATQAIGTSLADTNVFNSKHCQSMMMEVANMFLNTAKLNQISRGAKLFHLGPIEEEFPDCQQEVAKIIYNHRIAGYKNYDQTFALFDQLHAEGLEFEVVVTCVDNFTGPIINKPYVKVLKANDRKDYLEILKSTNINTSNSQHETFCISIAESMAAGHAVLCPNRVTFPELITNNETGLIFQNDEQQKAQLKKLILDREYRKKLGNEAKKVARHRFSSSHYADQVIELFETTKKEILSRWPKSEGHEKLEKLIREEPPAPMMKFYRQIQYGMSWMNQAFPLMYFSFCLERWGKKIVFKNNEPWVVKQ
jgi:glycosyltransferase involved in cell wall biosynthesis